jgi:hypothetical protein
VCVCVCWGCLLIRCCQGIARRRPDDEMLVEIQIEIYPLQKGVLKDIISPIIGCNSLVCAMHV